MAISFDESNDYFTIADDASLTLPDGDWCIGIWTYVENNIGTAFQYLLSNNNYAANNSLNLWLKEAAAAGGDNNKWGFFLVDGDGTIIGGGAVYSSSAPGADDTWRLIILQRVTASSRIELWFCTPRGTPSLEATPADTNFDAINGGTWYIGARADLDGSRFYGSIAAGFFKGNFSLSQSEIAVLGAGVPIWGVGKTPSVYLEMGTSEATLIDLAGSNNATRIDAPITFEHFPLVQSHDAVKEIIAADVAVGQPMELRGMTVPRIGRQWIPGISRIGGLHGSE